MSSSPATKLLLVRSGYGGLVDEQDYNNLMSSYAYGDAQKLKYGSEFVTNDDGRITKLTLYREDELSILPCPRLLKLDCLTEIELSPRLLLPIPGNLSNYTLLKMDLGDIPGNLPLSFNSLPTMNTFLCLQSRRLCKSLF